MINRDRLDLDKGELCLRVNRSNQGSNEINDVIRFLNDHPEITTIHFFQSSITKSLAEKLAATQTVKNIYLFSHSYVLFDFYKTSDPILIANFQRKFVQQGEVPSLTELSLFRVKNSPQLDQSLLPNDLHKKIVQSKSYSRSG